MSNHPSNFKTIRAQSVNTQKRNSSLPWILGCFGAVSIVAIILVIAGIAYFGQSSSSKSVVLIREPVANTSLFTGEPITLRAVARDDEKVKQVELWVDDILVYYENSDLSGGISPFPLITSWVPNQSGVYTISARSTNAKGNQSVDQIVITVLDGADTDADQIPDHLDACPEQPGTVEGQGCMDRDFDGIPDETDACPDEAGLPDDGCPVPSEIDRDGDGIIDDADACPDEVGSPTANGCIDTDGDGFADSEDECPLEPGLSSACPSTTDENFDEDGDGVLDPDDACPSTAGSPANAGCPDMAGVLPPPPSPEDDDDPPEEGGIFDELVPEPVEKAVVPVEIEAYGLYIRNDFETVTCYLDMNDIFDSPPRIFEFESNGTYSWDIAAQLDGDNSINTFADDEFSFDISLECLGHNGDSAETIYDNTVSHPSSEWDGRQLRANTDSFDFTIDYHICTPNCEESSLAAPYFSSITMGPRGEGPYIAHWEYDGNEDEIDGFAIAQVRPYDALTLIRLDDPSARSVDIADIEPACGENIELIMYTYKYNEDAPLTASRRSNNQIWTSREACRHTAMITFQTLHVHDAPADEDGLHLVGPVEGHFYVTNGTTTNSFWFDGIWRSTNGYRHDGMKLAVGTYRIQDLLDWINREKDSCLGNGCHSNSYYAPYNDFIVIPLDQREDLVISGTLIDDDTGRNADDTFFSGQVTVEFEDYESNIPFDVTIPGEYADLRFSVQIMPEE